jgi:phage shock protein A
LPETSCPDYETAFDRNPALADEQGLKAEDDLRIKYDNIIEKLNWLERQVEELKLEIGEIKDRITAARCIDSAPKHSELINQRQKN